VSLKNSSSFTLSSKALKSCSLLESRLKRPTVRRLVQVVAARAVVRLCKKSYAPRGMLIVFHWGAWKDEEFKGRTM
jgi:hypothetical protein